MGRSKSGKRKYSGLSLKEAMQMLEIVLVTPWAIQVPPRKPSDHLLEAIRRFESFDLEISEASKLLMVDALFAEIVPHYSNLKVWKSAPLDTDALIGICRLCYCTQTRLFIYSAYCALPKPNVMTSFKDGRSVWAKLRRALWNNRQEGLETDVFGIVSNGQIWQFYRRVLSGEVYESDLYSQRHISTSYLARWTMFVPNVPVYLNDVTYALLDNGVF